MTQLYFSNMDDLRLLFENLTILGGNNEEPDSIPPREDLLDTVTTTLSKLALHQSRPKRRPKHRRRGIISKGFGWTEGIAFRVLEKAMSRLCQSNPTAAVEFFTRLTASNPDRALLTEPQRREFLAHLCAGGSIEDFAAGGYSLEQGCKAILAVVATQNSGHRKALICRLLQTVENLQRKQAKGPLDRF